MASRDFLDLNLDEEPNQSNSKGNVTGENRTNNYNKNLFGELDNPEEEQKYKGRCVSDMKAPYNKKLAELDIMNDGKKNTGSQTVKKSNNPFEGENSDYEFDFSDEDIDEKKGNVNVNSNNNQQPKDKNDLLD